jgi:phage/plasmid-associated DNA primase
MPLSKAEIEKQLRIDTLRADPFYRYIQFKGAHMYSGPGTKGFAPLTREAFRPIAYAQYGGISRAGIDDLMDQLQGQAEDMTHTAHLIGMGDQLWDTRSLALTPADTTDYVYSTPLNPNPKSASKAMTFLMQLANGDEDLAHDYLQSMAPIFMAKRPAGVIWFVGDGANGKSSLLNALYHIIGKHFVSVTLSDIEDGRVVFALNGVLGNIVRESSEHRIEDTERYKAIGTHEPFSARRMRSNDSSIIQTDFHTIFNANNIPVFADKTKGARRRTLIVPFPAKFEEDNTFEERTFTPDFLSGLLHLILEETKFLRDNAYRYKFSARTTEVKDAYDADVNSAEAYVKNLIDSGIVAFTNYQALRNDYENWCNVHGLVALGVTALRRQIQNDAGVSRRVWRNDGRMKSGYIFTVVNDPEELAFFENGLATTNPIARPISSVSEEEVPEGGW